MANRPPQTTLGWQKLTFTHSSSLDSFPVRVRRQNSTFENVKLMEELLRFTDAQFPDAVNKYLALPQAFQFNQNALKHIQGFPEEAEKRTDVDKDWKSQALGSSPMRGAAQPPPHGASNLNDSLGENQVLVG